MLKNLRLQFIASLICLTVLVCGVSWHFLSREEVYYTVLPVKFDESNLPYIDVVLEEESFPVIVDLGCYLQLELDSPVLAKLKKTPYGFENWFNYAGLEFHYPSYILPKMELGTLVFQDVIATEFPETKKEDLVFWDPSAQNEGSQPSEPVGYLGRGFLKNMNFLLDLELSKIILTNSLKRLKADGYDLNSFIKIPFKRNSLGIVIVVETDLGEVELIVDTGCTSTLLRDNLYPKNIEKRVDHRGLPLIRSQMFVLGGKNFGSKNLYFLAMDEKFGKVSGLLGMDFIKEHVMYIDFSKDVIFVSP